MLLVRDIKLTALEEEIIQSLARLIEEELPEAKIMILFGSRALGSSDGESNMDLAIVLDLPMITRTFRERVWQLKRDVLGSLDAEEFPTINWSWNFTDGNCYMVFFTPLGHKSL